MVFESLVASLLNKFLGDYWDFDSSKLKLGIWGGDVALTNLNAKDSALDDFDLPIKVISGHIGKLILKIPYKNIYTAPTIATVEGLFIVVTPNQGIKYDAEKEAKAAEAGKQAELQRIEEAKTKAAEKGDSKEEKKDTFTEKLVTQIIKNLQVKIKDVHLRFEDNFSDPRNPFSLGFTLHNLSFQTTDEKWNPAIIQESINVIHKLVELDSFSVYWNSRSELYHKMDAEKRRLEMEKSIATSQFKPDYMKYMIGPINSKAKLILNPKPELQGFKSPKVWLDVVMEEIVVGLSRLQYQDLIKLLESLDRMTVASLYRKYRPDVPKLGHAKEWWNFAIEAILEEDVRRKRRNWSWEHMKQHLDCCKHYRELYVIKFMGKKLTNEMTSNINECEKKLDLFNITVIRKQAELEALKLSKKDKESKQSWGGWFGSFFSSNQNKTNDEDSTGHKIAKQIEEAMTEDEKQKLYDAIGYQETPTITEYPKEFVENKLNFLLHNLTLVLSDDTKSVTQVLKTNLKDVSATVQQRPAAQALSFDAKIDSFIVQGVPAGKAVPTIVTSRQLAESNLPLLSVLFEMNPLDGSCDHKLDLKAQPLQIIYDAPTINNLTDVFKPPEKAALQQLQATAMLKIEDLKEMSAFGLQYAIEQHKYMQLNIDMQPVFIIIPEKGVYTDDSHLIVVSLGNFQMASHQRDPQSPTVKSLVKAGSTEEEVLSTMIEKAYDKFEIEIKNIEILLTTPFDDWKEFIGQTSDRHHLLYPLSINIDFQKSIVTIDPRMPQMKIVGVLPLLEIGISDFQLTQVIKIGTSIPLPESDAPPPAEESTVQTLSSAVATDYVNSKVVQQVKREAVQNFKNVSMESNEDSDDSFSQKVSVQSTNMELNFEIEEFSFAMSRQVKEQDIKMLKFSFTNFGTTVTSRTFDMTANIYLGGILLESFEHKTPQGNMLTMISTEVNKTKTNLFTLAYLSTTKKNPDFESVHKSTLQTITADVKAIDFVLHQEAILDLMDFSNTLIASMQLSSAKPPTSSSSSETKKQITHSDEKGKSSQTKSVFSKKKLDSQIIDIQLNSTLESINLIICNKKYDLTDIRIKGMNASVTVQKYKTSVSALLKEMIVSDPSPMAIYPQVLF